LISARSLLNPKQSAFLCDDAWEAGANEVSGSSPQAIAQKSWAFAGGESRQRKVSLADCLSQLLAKSWPNFNPRRGYQLYVSSISATPKRCGAHARGWGPACAT